MNIAYTDGACEPNPGKGGWAYCVVQDDSIVSFFLGNHPNTTNHRMEFIAAIKVIKRFGLEISEVRTDSMLLVNTAMVWRHKWKAKNWIRSKKHGEVKNLDLVKELDSLLETHVHIRFTWVKGHSGEKFNEFCDGLASAAADF